MLPATLRRYDNKKLLKMSVKSSSEMSCSLKTPLENKNKMRVISGIAKGTNLTLSKRSKTRPISDRAKEILYGKIGPRIQRVKYLDIFAGTGAVGIEALSRGASFCTFIESNYSAIKTIIKNIRKCNFSEFSKVKKDNAFSFIKRCVDKYDIIFAGPPYNKDLSDNFLRVFDRYNKILKSDGILIIQCETNKIKYIQTKNLSNINVFCVGDSRFTVWVKKSAIQY